MYPHSADSLDSNVAVDNTRGPTMEPPPTAPVPAQKHCPRHASQGGLTPNPCVRKSKTHEATREVWPKHTPSQARNQKAALRIRAKVIDLSSNSRHSITEVNANLGYESKEGHTYSIADVVTHLSNRHGAENIQEDEGTVCGVIPQQISMRQPLDVGKGGERKLCHHSTIKSTKEKTKNCYFWKIDKLLSSRDESGTEIEH